MTKPAKITPMLQQYLEIKSQHQDAILFYRLGDFYEMFFDDAVTASRILGITLTSRSSKDDENRIPLCGIPFHAASSYLAKLVNAGHRVAVCEQVEDPREAKGVVKREVVRVVTPGLVTEELLLDDKENRYIASISRREGHWGLSLLDLTTGEFLITERDDLSAAIDELQRMSPSELLIDEEGDDAPQELKAALESFAQSICLTKRPKACFHPETARETLLDHFKTVNLAGFGCDNMTAAISAAGALLHYLKETQRTDLGHIEKMSPLCQDSTLIVDDASRRNLELTHTLLGGERQGSLLSALDLTQTPMGARLLKRNLLFPLRDVAEISRRLEAVEKLYQETDVRQGLRDRLEKVYDLERLTGRVVLGSANARDLVAMKASISQFPLILDLLKNTTGFLREIEQNFDTLAEIRELLEESICDDPPVTLREGNLIKPGYNAELDDLVSIQTNGKELILALESRERQRTGIGNLKVGYNKIFGYYLEVSRGQLANVPDDFIRKQTLVNAERFITPELKEFEEKVIGAEDKRLDLEYRLFTEIRSRISSQSSRLLKAASQVAAIDVISCLAEAARRYKYNKPEVNNGDALCIREGRHPVIERNLPAGRFVPNDILLDQQEQEVIIITGPNMAGKSTVLRQTALIVLMAQMGSFVPASEAVIGVVDRIFTRVGAMDDLRRAQSTFMVEMNETANILNNATEKSLVILDEIGRGTSTFDGLSIAWAVAEDLVTKNGRGVKTLFATHYHELTELAAIHDRVQNFHIAVREWNDSIIFLHKLMPGGTNRSYGIQVAALAGVPPRVVARAKELLHNIEKGEFTAAGLPRIAAGFGKKHHQQPSQLTLFGRGDDPLREKIMKINPDQLSPREAINILFELKELHDQE